MKHKLSVILEHSTLEKGVLVHDEYENIEIEVDCIAKINFCVFKSCKFYLLPNSKLTIFDSEISHCQFIGKGDPSLNIENLSYLTLGGQGVNTANDIEIEGRFRWIRIGIPYINTYKDTSHSVCLSISSSEIKDFNIGGSADYVKMQESIFLSSETEFSFFKKLLSLFTPKKKSRWTKRIRRTSTCENIIFENVEVNPFYLATKCPDKSSLDLTGATLVDKWSYLRKKYAGINLSIVFFFTLIFFLPIITRSFLLLLLSKFDANIVDLDKIYLWEALMFGGKEGWYAWIYCVLAIFLIVYNIGRFGLTLSIAKLREEELFLSDSGFSINSISPDKYTLQLKIDKCLNFMFVVTFLYSLLKIWDVAWLLVPNF